MKPDKTRLESEISFANTDANFMKNKDNEITLTIIIKIR